MRRLTTSFDEEECSAFGSIACPRLLPEFWLVGTRGTAEGLSMRSEISWLLRTGETKARGADGDTSIDNHR